MALIILLIFFEKKITDGVRQLVIAFFSYALASSSTFSSSTPWRRPFFKTWPLRPPHPFHMPTTSSSLFLQLLLCVAEILKAKGKEFGKKEEVAFFFAATAASSSFFLVSLFLPPLLPLLLLFLCFHSFLPFGSDNIYLRCSTVTLRIFIVEPPICSVWVAVAKLTVVPAANASPRYSSSHPEQKVGSTIWFAPPLSDGG